jgi:hypothetical protein
MAKQKVAAVETAEIVKEVKSVAEKRPTVIDKDRYVDLMNITKAGLTYKDRFGLEYRWEKEFDVVAVPFGELQTILSSKSSFLKEPYMFILEDDVIDALRLRSLYENLIDPREMEHFFKLGEQKISERLQKAPMAIKEMVIRKAREQVNELTVGKQRMIEQATGAKLVLE